METISPWVIEEILNREAEKRREIQEPLFIYDEPRQPGEPAQEEEAPVERGVCIILI